MPTTCGAPVWERFYMLAVYVWVSMLQSMLWAPIAAAPDAAKHEFPGLTDAAILLQLNWGPIVQMVFIPAAIALLGSRNGLQRCVRVGVVLSALAAALRVLALRLPAAARATFWAQSLLHAAGMLNGASASFLQGTPTRFSAVWFPPGQRARATGCAFVGLGLGQALCYALSPVLVRGLDELAPGTASCSSWPWPRPRWSAASRTSRTHPAAQGTAGTGARGTPAAAEPGALVVPLGAAGGAEPGGAGGAPKGGWRPLWAAMRRPSAVLLATLCGLANGPYQGWGAALPTISGAPPLHELPGRPPVPGVDGGVHVRLLRGGGAGRPCFPGPPEAAAGTPARRRVRKFFVAVHDAPVQFPR
ncbi:unnamed protein product [Prorocentrum cordatum]|uniref:Solute carrier family 40 protein n=1 Tax=Prorocentrum cordatum TaxID=2364126 RepID=A0ABN9SNL5_9DINO|nr:unnamed protein product [Polarella glacialis]